MKDIELYCMSLTMRLVLTEDFLIGSQDLSKKVNWHANMAIVLDILLKIRRLTLLQGSLSSLSTSSIWPG